MIKKTVFGSKSEDGRIMYVTKYMVFGLLIFQTEIDARIASVAPHLT